jgi:hypothetical protein
MKVALSAASGNIGSLRRGQLPRQRIDLRSAGWTPSIAPLGSSPCGNAEDVAAEIISSRIRSTPSHNPTKVVRL